MPAGPAIQMPPSASLMALLTGAGIASARTLPPCSRSAEPLPGPPHRLPSPPAASATFSAPGGNADGARMRGRKRSRPALVPTHRLPARSRCSRHTKSELRPCLAVKRLAPASAARPSGRATCSRPRPAVPSHRPPAPSNTRLVAGASSGAVPDDSPFSCSTTRCIRPPRRSASHSAPSGACAIWLTPSSRRPVSVKRPAPSRR
ncbi:hypothetical protein ABIB42_002460 [Massilia sp. UYP32]|nr:hypothetical protein [Massilia timonae]